MLLGALCCDSRESTCHFSSEPRGMDYHDEKVLTVKRIFNGFFKLIYFMTGQSFGVRSKYLIVLIVFVIKITSSVIIKIYFNSVKQKALISFVTDSSMDMIPLIEFTYLHFNLKHLNKAFKEFYSEFHINSIENRAFITSTRRFNCVCVIIIFIMFCLSFTVGLSTLENDRGWVVTQLFPIEVGLNATVEIVIAFTVYVYQAFISNYIILSTCFYLCYLKILLNCKEILLRNINSPSRLSLYGKLNLMDDLQSTFEDTLSFTPLLWSYYGIGPCLLFLLGFSSNTEKGVTYEDQAFLVYGTLNVLITLISLFFISKWQEAFEGTLDKVVLNLEETANSPLQITYIRRIESILGKQVTLFLIFPIDRSLILGYIGSAITFSTLFLQFK